MGQSSSSGRRRDNYYQTPPPPPPPPPSNHAFAWNSPYTPPSRPGYSHPPPPPPQFQAYSQQPTAGYGNYLVRLFDLLMGRPSYPPYYGANPGAGRWAPAYPHPFPASSSSAMTAPPPPFVEHQQAKTVKNSVNVHKDTIRLAPDEWNPDRHLVSFTFDAVADGSVTIYYFAKEGTDCSFYPVYADMYMPIKVPFQKGPGQKFCQPSGSGIDLGFFELDELLKPLHGDVYPLVIYAEACPLPQPTDEHVGKPTAAAHAQITQAVIENHNDGSFQVKVIKQILWVDGVRYELQEIFGLVSSAEAEIGGGDDDSGKECVICMSEPRDTAVLPCRHLCMCSECAKALRLQSNKCPICRQPVERLMEITVNSGDR